MTSSVRSGSSNASPSRLLRTVACLLLGIAPLPSVVHAEQPLPRTTLQAGIHLIRAEVAATPASRTQGLMHRERLGPNEGMLFVFEQPGVQCFWMRNTLVPLTIAFLGDDGRIVNTADMQPKSDESHCSGEPVRYALEMEKGWFARRGLSTGDRLKAPAVFGSRD